MIRPLCRDDEILNAISRKATKKDIHLAKDLEDTIRMYMNCTGMSADMIGENVQAVIVKTEDFCEVMFNPVIIKQQRPYEAEEYCLVNTGPHTAVRYFDIEVEYRDRHWKRRRKVLKGLPAQVVQHEMDHLQGRRI